MTALHHLADQHGLIAGDVTAAAVGAGPDQLGQAGALVLALLKQKFDRKFEAAIAATAFTPAVQPEQKGLAELGPIGCDLVLAEGRFPWRRRQAAQTDGQALQFAGGESQQGLAHGSRSGKKAASVTSSVGTTKARSRN